MKLYTKTICPKCMWVKSELQRAGLEVEVVNIDENEQAKQTIIDAGFFTVPVLEFDGQLIGDVQEIVSHIELVAG
ncbi:glutaredoxin family protein [Ureibacillus sp. GCM10028918]|uniref:glutaredoxin family protein n=1 Tax=Ureibacillus sp. GCM10028918 TaxID=3273429 RepID=UPI003611DB82